MKYTTYIIKGDEGYYKGFTNNIERRLSEHKKGRTKSTKKLHNIKLIYKEEYDNFTSARQREIYLKSAAGRKFIQNKLKI